MNIDKFSFLCYNFSRRWYVTNDIYPHSIDYVLWQDDTEIRIQLDYISKQLKRAIESGKGKRSGAMSGKADLFDDLQSSVGCSYISDMRCGKYNELAKERMSKMDIKGVPLGTFSDMAEYLYKK